jgi:hypothetical protein
MSPRLLSSTVVLSLAGGFAEAFVLLPIEDECSVSRPTCGQPPAVVASPHQLHAALPPAIFATEFDACAVPRATCVRPAAATLGPVRSVVQTFSISVSDALDLWERSAATRPPVTDRDRVWLSRRNEPALSTHAAEIAARLLGPVQSAPLMSEFEWSVVSTNANELYLEGRPSDEATRLFCSQVRVMLDRATGTVCQLEMANREGSWNAVKCPAPMGSEPEAIKLAAYVAEEGLALPPSPTPQRLAAESADRPAVR